MAADDIAAVNLPPIAPTSDAPPQDSRRGSNEKSRGKRKAKAKAKDQDPNEEQHRSDPADPNRQQPEPNLRGRKSPHTDIDFERPEHELDKFA